MLRLVVGDYYYNKLITNIIIVKYCYTYWMDDNGNYDINGYDIQYASKTRGININSLKIKKIFIILELLNEKNTRYNSYCRIDNNYPELETSSDILPVVNKLNLYIN